MSDRRSSQIVPGDGPALFDDVFGQDTFGDDAPDYPPDIDPDYEQYQADRESIEAKEREEAEKAAAKPEPEPSLADRLRVDRQARLADQEFAAGQRADQLLGREVRQRPEPEPEPEVVPEPEPDNEDDLSDAEIDAVIQKVMDEADKPVEVTDDQLAQGEKVAAATVVFELSVKKPGWSKKQNPISIVAEQHLNALPMLKSTKKLLECDELDEIDRCIRRFRDWLDVYKCRTKLLRGGMYLMPLNNVELIEQRYQGFKTEFRQKVATFMKSYVEAKKLARATLGELYDDTQYPPLSQIARAYWVGHRWLAFDAPKALKGIKANMFAEASEKLRVQLANAAGEMEGALLKEMREYVDWMVGKLTFEPGSKSRKEIREDKIQETLQFFDAVKNVNITGNKELTELAENAKRILGGATSQVKKNKSGENVLVMDDAQRQEMANAFGEMKKVSDSWVVESSSRMLSTVDDL